MAHAEAMEPEMGPNTRAEMNRATALEEILANMLSATPIPNTGQGPNMALAEAAVEQTANLEAPAATLTEEPEELETLQPTEMPAWITLGPAAVAAVRSPTMATCMVMERQAPAAWAAAASSSSEMRGTAHECKNHRH